MKVSLILPVFRESHRLAAGLRDLQSFFARLPLEVEVVIVCEPGEKQHVDAAFLALEPTTKALQTVILENPRFLGRGPSLQRGLDQATGDVLVPITADLSIPLAEVFAALQEFLRDPEGTEFVIGNRRSLKRLRHGQRTRLKKFFDDVEHDKAKSLQVPDPTCPFWMIKKELWTSVSPRLRLSKWYSTPGLLRELRNQKAGLKMIDTNCHDDPETRFRWWYSVLSGH